MKRTLFALLLLLAPAIAARAAERYVVALGPEVRTARALLRDIDVPADSRDVVAFANLDAFAADLTGDEVRRLRASRGVRYVERVVERHILGFDVRPSPEAFRNLEGQTIPAGIDAIRARDVWTVTRGDSVNVAVIDTGIDHAHPDLVGSYAGGFNAITGSADPMDDHGHGTHVAGVIAARDNDIGVVGVAPGVRLWGVKSLRENGSGTSDLIVAGIDWVIGQKRARGGNWIINLSIGSQTANEAEREAVARAVAEGILVVAGSGNDSSAVAPAPVSYPAAYRGVLAVGAIDDRMQHAPFSNRGPELAVVAPGVDVLSTVRTGTGMLTGIYTGAGTVGGNPLEGSGKGVATGRIVYCGIGRPEDFTSSVNGQIAILRRGGGIAFSDKTRRAKAAGATAVLVVNYAEAPGNDFSLFDGNDPGDRTYAWPVTISLVNADGERLIAAAGSTVTVANRIDDYGSKTGTSMASPHAAGVAALVWSVAPNASAVTVMNALKMTATDLGAPDVDAVHGHGALHAFRAASMLNPAAFGIPPSGRRVLRRGR